MLFASTLYIGSVFLATQGKTFRLDSDYDSNIPIISFVVDTVRNEHRFPLRNPYVTTGISVLGDPLSGSAYLPYLLPMLLFGVQSGWWVVIGLHAFMAGAFMWVLLRDLLTKKSGFDFALWGGLLYMGSGAFAARIAAGHIEKVLSYPWYPLLLLALLKKDQTNRNAILIGAIMGIVFLTGDVYGVFYMGMFYGVIRVIRSGEARSGFAREIRGIGWAILAFVVASGVKLVPFFIDVAPVIARYSSFDAAKGSLHLFYSWIPFIVPLGVTFYDRPLFQHVFGIWYNWYEYYAFIGLPIFFLIALPKILKRREVQILIMLLIVGIMYIARGYPYSIFYWMNKSIPVLNWFRAPQRMYEALTGIMVIVITLCAKHVIRPPKNTFFLWGMLSVTLLISGYQMTNAFEIPRVSEERLIDQLRAGDGGDMTVASFACCMQKFLVAEKIRVINYYYGWRPKGAPRFTSADGSTFAFETIQTSRPAYIIAPKDMEFRQYGYEVWFGDEKNNVWRVSILS
ncbi:MAG: hypothetical protein AAB800_01760 [Patescibacteria group bacterium]